MAHPHQLVLSAHLGLRLLHSHSPTEANQRAELNRLEQEKAVVEHRIQELRSFEREYRLRLKSYIESQLSELDAAGVAPQQQPGNTPGLTI